MQNLNSQQNIGLLQTVLCLQSTNTVTLVFPVTNFGQHPLICRFITHFKLVYWVPVKALWNNASKNLWSGGISFFALWEAGSCLLFSVLKKPIHVVKRTPC